MAYKAELIVRSYECDSYNHVNNAVYLNYLEFGRMEFLHAIGFNYAGIIEAGYYLYVTHIDIYYKASAFLNDKLTIEVKPIKLKKISGDFKQTIYKQDGTICVEANVTWACVSAKDSRPAKIPAEFLVSGLEPEKE